MANTIEILIKARDEATRQLQAVSGAVTQVGDKVQLLSGIEIGRIVADGLTQAVRAAQELGAAVADFAASAEDIQNAATRSGTTAQQYQALKIALEEAGIPAGSLPIAFRELNNAIASGDQKLAALGITARDAWGALLQIADVIAKTEDPATRTRIATQLLGARMGDALIPVLERGSAALIELQQQAEDTGAALSDDALVSAAALDNQLDELGRRVDGLRNKFLEGLIPVLSASVAGLDNIINRAILAQSVFTNLGAAIDLVKEGRFKEAGAALALNNKIFQEHERLLRAAAKAQNELNNAQSGTAPQGDPATASGVRAFLKLLQDAQGVKLTDAQKQVADFVRLFDVAADSAAEYVGVLRDVEEQGKRLQVRDQLLKVGIDIDQELIRANLLEAQRIFAAAGLKMPVAVVVEDADTDAMDRALANIEARAEASRASVEVGASPDLSSVDAALRSIGVELSAEQLETVVAASPDLASVDRVLADMGVRADAATILALVRTDLDEASVDAALAEMGVTIGAAEFRAAILPEVDLRAFDQTLQALGIHLSEEELKVKVVPVREPAPTQADPRDGLAPPEPIQFDFENAKKQQEELLKTAISTREVFASVAAGWRSAVEDMTQTTTIANETFGALFNGLQSGFGQVFANITNSAQTFKSAVVTVINAMVQEILAALARLAAAKVFGFLLGLVTGGAGFAISAALPGGGAIGLATGGAPASQSRAQAADQAQLVALLREQNELLATSIRNQPAPGDTIYLSGLNTRDVYESYVTPGGELRRANDRMVEIAAVG